jgi:hypothetical protein
MKELIKLDWNYQAAPLAHDFPIAVSYGKTIEVFASYYNLSERRPWARLRIAPPEEPEEEAEADPLSEWRFAWGIREAMIAASNAPSADAARRWFNDRFLEVMEANK